MPRRVWVCTRPGCGLRHGAHADGRPLGIPGDARTNQARISAHATFDRLWQYGFVQSRADAYLWLQSAMRLPEHEAHIARFSAETCAMLEKLCSLFMRDSTDVSRPIVELDPWGLAPPGTDPDGPIDFEGERRAELARGAADVNPFENEPFAMAPDETPPSGPAPILYVRTAPAPDEQEDPFYETPEGL